VDLPPGGRRVSLSVFGNVSPRIEWKYSYDSFVGIANIYTRSE